MQNSELPQASVAAEFVPPAGHPAVDILREQGIEAEDHLVLRSDLGSSTERIAQALAYMDQHNAR